MAIWKWNGFFHHYTRVGRWLWAVEKRREGKEIERSLVVEWWSEVFGCEGVLGYDNNSRIGVLVMFARLVLEFRFRLGTDFCSLNMFNLKLLNRIATVKDDGTVEFEVPGDVAPHTFGVGSGTVYNGADNEPLELTDPQNIPPLQIVILIVGTRDDVQPFIAIGKRLQDYGYRVRLATHSNFKDFVLTAGLEFYPLGGDPKILAGYMVKNKGFLPSGPSEIPVQRNQIKDIIYSLLPAGKEPDMDSGIPFKADAIMANPPVYGHTHVAEALKVPLHVFFTMPSTPTSEFPHPLSRVKQSAGYRLSYQIVDSLIWLGIRDMVNDLRMKKLKLWPVTYFSGSQGSESDVHMDTFGVLTSFPNQKVVI
ncbi:hypothetical protein ACSBR1_032908 [Camellia fascicularis]